jgi:hypothetical protein
MHKVNFTMAATIFLVTATGLASAADPNRSEQKKPETSRAVGNSSQQEADYLAAVKKCEGTEPKEKQHCIESAKERFGEMLR